MKPYLALFLGCTLTIVKFSNGNDIRLTDGTPDLSELNIIEVLNTTERLWFYQTSHTGEDTTMYTCIYNTMKNISTEEYNFTQTFREIFAGERNVSLTGKFLKRWRREPPVSMLVENPYKLTKQHTLMFWDGRGCSVFYVNLYNNIVARETPICEMYLKDSYVGRGPEDSCRVFYSSKCTASHVLYSEKCRLRATTPPSIYEDTSADINYDLYTPSYDTNEIGR
ncbi:uncharacterized protein LOC144118344 isoform X1 [Amblyomma americanum]